MATKRSDQEWLDIFQTQRDSGLSITQFCKDNTISEGVFYSKRRQLVSSESFLPVVVEDISPSLVNVCINNIPVSFDSSIDDESLSRLVRICSRL